jgi:hypothetical protein
MGAPELLGELLFFAGPAARIVVAHFGKIADPLDLADEIRQVTYALAADCFLQYYVDGVRIRLKSSISVTRFI